jgi:serine/threonine protein kinase
MATSAHPTAATTRCPGCFSDTGGAAPCPRCGFDPADPGPASALAPGTVLNEQFVIGRVLGKPGGFGITYLALDRALATRVAIKEYLPRDLAVRAADGVTITPHSSGGFQQTAASIATEIKNDTIDIFPLQFL